MKLYGSYTSPFVRHCRVALEETGEQYQFVETDYTQKRRRKPCETRSFHVYWFTSTARLCCHY